MIGANKEIKLQKKAYFLTFITWLLENHRGFSSKSDFDCAIPRGR